MAKLKNSDTTNINSTQNDNLIANIYSLNLNYSDFITIEHSASTFESSFLVDTQADISVLKINHINSNIYIDKNEQIDIRGITDMAIASLGTSEIDLYFPDTTINHKFHIVSNNFQIPAHGILGKDFLKRFNCQIDYEKMQLVIKSNKNKVFITIQNGPNPNSMVIPPRCEVVRIFHIENYSSPQFIDSSEIKNGVFISKTIAKHANPLVKVLNTTFEPQIIKNVISETENLSNYDIYEMNPLTKNTTRRKCLLKLIEKDVPEYAKEKLIDLCTEYEDIFAVDGDQLTINNFYTQKLRLKDPEPIYVKNYRLPKTQKTEINRQVNELLENNLIEQSISSYNSPLILVPKKTNDNTKKWRMCVDFRMLNKKLIQDKYPLPRIDDILDSLGKAKYFSTLDLYSGFHQIAIDKESREYTAFSTENGSFQWKVLPFGLNIAPNSFMRMMNIAFSGLKPEQSFVYMDDIIVIGKSELDHMNNLRAIFEKCRKFNLKLNPEKCKYFRSEVLFLGHTCTSEGLLPDESKINAIKKYTKPTNKDDVKRLVAFANYYRRFIQNFANLVRPLNHLTKKRSEFIWSDECEKAFETLKKKLISPPILKYPDFTKQFIVTVDASNYACGAVLSQDFNGEDLPICYISRNFQKGEINKATIEKELLAIYFAVTYLRPYLYGNSFIVRSDHKPLVFLYNIKNPASKLTRIRLELEEYDFVVEYIKGKNNVAADALSRIHIKDIKQISENSEDSKILAITRSMTKKSTQIIDKKPDEEEIIENQYISHDYNYKATRRLPQICCKINKSSNNIDIESAELKVISKGKCIINIDISIIDTLKTEVTNRNLLLEEILCNLQKSASNFRIKNLQWPLYDKIFEYFSSNELIAAGNTILRKIKIYLTKPQERIYDENEKLKLITEYHENPLIGGHFGSKQVYAKLRQRYYWPKMTMHIAKYVKSCKKCQINKVRYSNKEKLMITPTPIKPFDIVVIDTIGPFTKSDNENIYAVTMMCDLTKYLVTAPIPNKEARTVAKAIIDNFILIFGPMRNIKTDCGTEYKNEIVRELCSLLKITHNFSTPYHHETLGTIERNHRVLNEYFRAYLTDNNWDEHLKNFTFCYNISFNASLQHNYTPYELVFARKCILPTELTDKIDPIYNVDNYIKVSKFYLQKAHEHARALIEKSKIRNKEYYDRKSNPLNISVNDEILIQKEPYNKLQNIYDGPHRVKEINGHNVTININGKKITLHKNRIRKF